MLDVFQKISDVLRINPEAAKLVSGGFLVMTVALSLVQETRDERFSFGPMLVVLVVVMLIMLGLSSSRTVARSVLGWFVIVVFIIWSAAIMAQAVTGNKFEQLGSAYCIGHLHFPEVCQRSTAAASQDDAARGIPLAVREPVAAREPDVSPPQAPFPQGMLPQAVPPATNQIPPAAPGEPTAPPAADHDRIFIQFAGYPRDTIVQLATSLSAEGWNVADRQRGGERLASATGLNEVRFFHAADEAAAIALGQRTAAHLSKPTISVKDLSRTPYAQSARQGHLELWLSP